MLGEERKTGWCRSKNHFTVDLENDYMSSEGSEGSEYC